MRVPTEAEGHTRLLLVRSGASQPLPSVPNVPFSEFAVFDDDEDAGDDSNPQGVLVPGSAPPAPLLSPQDTPPTPADIPLQTEAAPSDSAAPDASPDLPPLTVVPEPDEVQQPRPGSANTPGLEATPGSTAANGENSAAGQPAAETGATWEPEPPVQAPPIAAPPQQSATTPAASIATPSVGPTTTLTGRAASVVARQKAMKSVPGGWLLVPRRTIFVQGGLMIAIGLLAFFAGWLAGSGPGGSPGETPTVVAPNETVLVQGTVMYRSEDHNVAGDEGAIIIAWPRGTLAEPRIDPRDFHPSRPVPAEGSRAMLALEEIGGKYARASADGTFNLVVPRRGEYYVLIVSRNTRRPTGEAIADADLDVLGRVFAPVTTGIDPHKYHLALEKLDTGLEMRSHDFARSGM